MGRFEQVAAEGDSLQMNLSRPQLHHMEKICTSAYTMRHEVRTAYDLLT